MNVRSRKQLLILCILCLFVTPVLLMGLFIHALMGSQKHALRMAIALDECGNALFVGLPTETISSRVGRKALSGSPFWQTIEKIINFFFGAAHCQKSMLHALRYKSALEQIEQV